MRRSDWCAEQQIRTMLASSLRLCNQCRQSLPAVLKELIQPKGFQLAEPKKSTALTPLSLNIPNACCTQTHTYNLQPDGSIDRPIHHSLQTWMHTLTHTCTHMLTAHTTCFGKHFDKYCWPVITFITSYNQHSVVSSNLFIRFCSFFLFCLCIFQMTWSALINPHSWLVS